jgi:uncharacterized membrane protein YphA (DoxX/SURF4 family)
MFTREAFTAFSQPHKLPIMATTEVTTPSTTSLADIGLLILRIGVGAAMIQAGLRKAVDFSTVVTFMESGGWRLPRFAAFMVTAAETAGGIGLLFGLLTPLAACAVMAAMIDAWAVNVSGAAIWSDPFNVPFVIAIGAGCAAVHRGWRLLRRRQNLWKLAIRCAGRGRTAGRGDRRGTADLDIAERSQPDPLHRACGVEPTRR